MAARQKVVRLRADWIQLLETAHAPARDDAAWADSIAHAARSVFTDAAVVGLYSIEHSPDLSNFSMVFNTVRMFDGESADPVHLALRDNLQSWGPFHLGPPVLTYGEVTRKLRPDIASNMGSMRDYGYGDGVGVVAHPAPGVITVLHAVFERPIELLPYERMLLTRVALHLDAAHRARRHPESVTAELSSKGHLVRRDVGSPGEHVLEEHAARLKDARSLRCRASADAIELWSALVAGRVSVVPRGEGARARYLVLDNPPSTHGLRALSPGESTVLALAARGISTKLIAYGLGLSSSIVSSRLANAASKIGVLSRTELIRVAALLARDPRAGLPETELTAAERDVLELLQQGLTNRDIANLRSRSVRTIANQVAALLRKTGSSSRRQLIVREKSRTRDDDVV